MVDGAEHWWPVRGWRPTQNGSGPDPGTCTHISWIVMKIKYKKAPDGLPDWLDDSSPIAGEYSCGPAKSWWLFTILPWKTCHKFGSPLSEHTHGGLIGPPCLWVALKVSKLSWNGASLFPESSAVMSAQFSAFPFLWYFVFISSSTPFPIPGKTLATIAALLHWPLLDTVGPLASVHYFYSLFGWSEGGPKKQKKQKKQQKQQETNYFEDMGEVGGWHSLRAPLAFVNICPTTLKQRLCSKGQVSV